MLPIVTLDLLIKVHPYALLPGGDVRFIRGFGDVYPVRSPVRFIACPFGRLQNLAKYARGARKLAVGSRIGTVQNRSVFSMYGARTVY